MLTVIEKLVVDKEEIVTEEIKTVKMLVPMSFELNDGMCEDEETQALYEFLTKREEVDVMTESPQENKDLDDLIRDSNIQ